MAATAPSVESFCNLLVRSRLLQAQEVQALHRRWRHESKEGAANLERFSRWIVTQNYVTEYQIQSLLRGRIDHFFLNHYKILDRIGKGRMAGVFKAMHSLGHVVAIKVLPPSKAKDPQLMARFRREARMAQKLKHPHVVRTFHLGDAAGLQFLVMEYLEGETLDEVLKRRGKLPAVEGVRLIHQALVGLQHIHEQGMIHRDLKPANLMLVPGAGTGGPDNTLQSTVKILDIGLGRILADEDEVGAVKEMNLTCEGAMLGTPDYLSPEQARDAHKVDIRADIYSLGCVLYHVLSGQILFPVKNVYQQMICHATEMPRPIREIEPSIPDGLQQILNWMLAKEPSQRYPTPERAAQALQVFLAGVEPERPPEAGPEMQSYLKWVDKKVADDGDVDEADLPASLPPPPAPARGPGPETVKPLVPSTGVAAGPMRTAAAPAPAVTKTAPAPVPAAPVSRATTQASPAADLSSRPVPPPFRVPGPETLKPFWPENPPVPRTGELSAPATAGAVPDTASAVPLRVPPPSSPLQPFEDLPDGPDVELVPITADSTREPPAGDSLRLSRRDYMLLIIGIWLGTAGVLLLEGVIWLLVQALR